MNPMPLPIEIKLSRDTGPEGEEMVVFNIVNFHGQFVFFVDFETAKELGKSLTEVTAQANSGLILPKSGLVL